MNRRALLLGTALFGILLTACGGDADDGGAVSATVAPPPTSTTTTTVPPTTGAPPTSIAPQALPGGSLDVLVLGDSVMFDAAAAIEAAVESGGAADLASSAIFGFGFSDGAAVPFSALAPDILAASPAEQVVVMVGSWDHLAVQRDPEAYAAAVRRGLDQMAADGRSVLLLGEPPSDPDKGEEEARLALNDILATEAAAVAGVRYLPTDTVIGDADGAYIATAGGQLLRKPDGRHLCPAGAARFGTAVQDALSEDWALPAADPAWAAGAWRTDPRYDDPPGACTG